MRYSGLRSRGRSIMATFAASATLAGVLIGIGQSPAAAVTPPVAVDDTYTTSMGTALVQAAPGVLVNDTDDVGPLTASGASNPPYGSVNLNANGSFTYTPDANFVGTDTFTYTVGDGVDGSDTGLVTITVNRNEAVLLKDLDPGAGSGSGGNFVDIGGGNALFYSNAAATQGLWKTDGSAAGTMLLKSLNLSVIVSPANQKPIGVGGKWVFQASDGVSGSELWVTDGTAAGTVLLKDINPGGAHSLPTNLAQVGGNLFFQAQDGTNGAELWKTDGTTAGTVLLKDINPGTASSTPNCGSTTLCNGFPVMGSSIYFAANDGTNGTELWTSDGTLAGTQMVANINPGAGSSSSPQEFAVLSSNLLFRANGSSAQGAELWKSDGTAAGTVLVKEIRTGTSSSNPNNLFPSGGIVLFNADDGVVGPELWKTDGTTAGTVLLKDIRPGTSLSNANNFAAVLGTVMFQVNDGGATGIEYWKTDGTTAGTVIIKDINPAGSSPPASPPPPTQIGSVAYVSATDNTRGVELWKTDGTAAGTVLAQDINPGSAASSPRGFAAVLGTMLFNANDGINGTELWRLAPPNTPPVAVTDGYSTNEDTPLVVAAPGVVGNDTDANSNVLHDAVKMSDPAHGSVAFGGDGSFTYTPAANYNGPDSFTYKSFDGMDYSNAATVNLTVTSVPDTPVAVTDTYSTNQNASLTVASPGVLGNDTDGDGDALTASSPSLPAHGAVALNPGGGFTYTPNANYTGPDSFTYTVSDGSLTATGTVNIAVSVPAISASPASVSAGSAVTATWSGIGNPTATDWVGLYDSASAPNPALLAWAYTGGGAGGNLNLTVPLGATPGAAYELRLFANNTYTRLATSAPFTVTASAATIAASPASVTAGSQVTATWSGIAAPTGTDWVGLYVSASASNPALLAWAYTGGGAAGNLNLTVPGGSTPGAGYELRLFTNNTYTRLATSAPFTVTASAAAVAATPSTVNAGDPVTATWSGIASPNPTDWVGLYGSAGDPDPSILAWAYTGGAAAGNLNLTVPVGSPSAATYELRLFSNNTYTRLATSAPFSVVASAATVSASPATVAAGGDVTATWSGIGSPNAQDWIGLYASGSDPDTAIVGEVVGCCQVNSWAYTAGAAGGSFTLHVPAGATPGSSYELRLFSNNSYTRLATSAPFTVT